MRKTLISRLLFSTTALSAGVFAGYMYDTGYMIDHFLGEQVLASGSVQLLDATEFRELASTLETKEELISHLRSYVIKYLWNSGFTSFIQKPYAQGNGILERKGSTGFVLTESIIEKDDVQTFVEQFIRKGKRSQGFVVTDIEVSQWDKVFLFREQKDLELLGYEVVSSRERISKDDQNRRHNIKQVFDMMGGVRVVNSGSLAFMHNINYDPKVRKLYAYGNGIVNGLVRPVYAGGICGASTALMQGLLTNTALELDGVNHSKRYSALYNATISDKDITTPGLDATVFRPSIDFVVTNTQPYPTIIAMNFDGQKGSEEEVFSLAMPTDKGSFFYNKTYNRGSYSCYSWTVNSKNHTSCYNTVK